MSTQLKQEEWYEQWQLVEDNEFFLFRDWIIPNTIEDFSGKDVLEAGCGGGQHTSFVAPVAKSLTSVDLNTVEIARKRNSRFDNIKFVESDIAVMDLGQQFDIVFSIGVVHHTDNPDATVLNLYRHVKPGGKLILWIYSAEGNELVAKLVEPARKAFFRYLSRPWLLAMSKCITALMYLPIYSIYLLPLSKLPFYEYFKNFRSMTFERNVLNVFDKLNAPQTQFISRDRIAQWLVDCPHKQASVEKYVGVSWRVTIEK